MYSDPMTHEAEVQYRQEHLMALAEKYRQLKIDRAKDPGLPARLLLPRMGEALASVWISLACSWHSALARQAPSRC